MIANTDDVNFKFKVSFGILNFRGKYQIDARLLLLRLVGSGDITGNFSKFVHNYLHFSVSLSLSIYIYIFCIYEADYDSDVVLRADKIIRNNDTYLQFEKMKIGIKVGRANIHLSNLFGGDPILGKFIYENFKKFHFPFHNTLFRKCNKNFLQVVFLRFDKFIVYSSILICFSQYLHISQRCNDTLINTIGSEIFTYLQKLIFRSSEQSGA